MNQKIAWIPAEKSRKHASSRMRAYLPCEHLRGLGIACEIYNQKNVAKYGVVIFQKNYTDESLRLAQYLKGKGIYVIFDICDNHFYVPNNTKKLVERAERFNKMVALSDLVSVSSKELQKCVVGKPTWLIDDIIEQPKINSLKRWFYEHLIVRKKQNVCHVVWYGGAGGNNPPFGLIDLPAILPYLEKLHQEVRVQLTVISNSKRLFNKLITNTTFPVRYRRWTEKSFPYLFMAQDVCIIPVNQNPFTVCKTNNRLVTSLTLGVPVVADAIPSYQEFHQVCFLDNWMQGLLSYAKSPQKRHDDVMAGKELFEERYSNKRVLDQWQAMFAFVNAQRMSV